MIIHRDFAGRKTKREPINTHTIQRSIYKLRETVNDDYKSNDLCDNVIVEREKLAGCFTIQV